MNSKENRPFAARSRDRQRALWWSGAIVLCVLIAVVFFVFFVVTNKEAKPAGPYLESANDKPAANSVPANDKTVTVHKESPAPEPNKPDLQMPKDWVETVSKEISKEAEDVLPAKIRKHRAELLETLSKETTFDSIENLPNFDDTRVLHTITLAKSYDSYNFLSRFIPKLNRVRKILVETAGDPNKDDIIAVLKQKLEYSTEGYTEVLLEFRKAMLKDRSVTRTSEPLEWERRQTYAAAATYLLSELRAYKALPLMSKVYHHKEKLPVSRLFVFYAMHLLAKEHPRTGLSPQAEKALDEYLEAAKEIPEPYVFSVPTYKAAYHDSDFRVTIIGQDLLKNQLKMQIRQYPWSLEKLEKESWGTPTIDPHWLAVDPKIDKLANKLKAFIQAAYPETTK